MTDRVKGIRDFMTLLKDEDEDYIFAHTFKRDAGFRTADIFW